MCCPPSNLTQALSRRALTHTTAARPRPHPTLFAPGTPRRRHFPTPPVPSPAPSNPTHVLPIPASAPFLPANPLRSRILATALETHAHPCYYPKRGTDPAARKPDALSPLRPNRDKARASVGASKYSHRRAPCLTLPRGVTLVSRQPRVCMTDWCRSAGTPSYEAHRMSQKLTEFAFAP